MTRSVLSSIAILFAVLGACAVFTPGCNGIKSGTTFLGSSAGATPLPVLTGQWSLLIQEFESNCDAEIFSFDGNVQITREGDSITISAVEEFTATGTIEGNTITFTYTVELPGGETKEYSGVVILTKEHLEFNGDVSWDLFDDSNKLICSGADEWDGNKIEGDGVLSGIFFGDTMFDPGPCDESLPTEEQIYVEVSQLGDVVTFNACIQPIGSSPVSGLSSCFIVGTISGRTITIDETVGTGSFVYARSGEVMIAEDFNSFELHVDETYPSFGPKQEPITCESFRDWSMQRE